jgi:large subunit ribosomal protein L20
MTRIKRGTIASKRRKNILSKTKGFIFGRSKKFRQAKQAFLKAGSYAYRDRRNKKRDLRRLWITRINNACREHELTYGRFIDGLNKSKIEIDRKVLAELAVNHPETFEKITAAVKK